MAGIFRPRARARLSEINPTGARPASARGGRSHAPRLDAGQSAGGAPAIVECAERRGCAGIVMGTRGHSSIGNLLLGSIATRVVHRTRLPVTLVK
jgi:nucleotide-binding universal stress UspA family protein